MPGLSAGDRSSVGQARIIGAIGVRLPGDGRYRGTTGKPQAVPRSARPAISLRSNPGIFWARQPGLPNAAGALEPFNSAAVDNTEAKLD